MSIIQLPGPAQVDRQKVGGKAWSIHRMQSLGMPVPPAFVIGTDICSQYYAAGRSLPGAVADALPAAMAWLEHASGKNFGGGARPLLVSVRSGAAISMPGMMDTVLNLGVNDDVEKALARYTGSAPFASEVRQRFAEQFSKIVGTAPPDDPWSQLTLAIEAVFDSWNSARAVAYRRDRGLPDDGGTAVTVQAMIFGNVDEHSGTGVLFSRDPSTGEASPYGEWLRRGQGEEVVSGQRTPERLDALAALMPEVHAALIDAATRLEHEAADVQDIEFTVEAGKLWLLQSRSAKRTPQAALRLAVALHEEGLISRAQALARISPEQVEAALLPAIDPVARQKAQSLAIGRVACPGVAAGTLVTDVDEAERRAEAGESIILARPTTDPDDVHAMSVVAGVLTELGGATSHAAVVSREIGVPCIVGCGAGSLMPLHGREVTVDAIRGEVLAGRLPVQAAVAQDHPGVRRLSDWARAEWRQQPARSLVEMLRARRAHE